MLIVWIPIDFQGLNYIPPTPHYPGMYSTYLLDHVRVPGLKPDKCKDDGSTPPSKKARVIVSVSHNTSPEWPDVKLNLIPFAVFDQAECITSHPFSSDSVTDDDDNQAEMDSAANDHPKHRLSNTNSNSQQIVVYSAQLPQKNPISWSKYCVVVFSCHCTMIKVCDNVFFSALGHCIVAISSLGNFTGKMD